MYSDGAKLRSENLSEQYRLRDFISTAIRFLVSRNIAHTVLIIIQLVSNIMSFGHISDEERKKRREQFEGNKARLGFGANVPQGSLLGAGKLGQQAQIGVSQPAQVSPQIATNIASKQREQNIAQQQQAQLQQRATREANAQDAKQAAQNIIKMPVKQQAQAVEQLKAQAPKNGMDNYQPSKAGDLAIGAAQASTYLPQAMFAGTNALTGGKLSELAKSGGIHPQNFRDNLERFKTQQQVEAGVPQATKPAPNLGMVSNPNAANSVNVSDGAIAKEARAEQGIDDEANVLNPIYSEGVTRGNPNNKKFGLSVDNNAAVAQPIAPTMGGGSSARGFGVMAAPRKAYGEDSRRQALAMDIRPYAKMGGRLTTGQIALKNSIITGDDEKYANEQYQGQLSAAQKLAQEGMTQNGANSRAQLTESGANSRAELSELGANTRAGNQLGFDAEKFQQVAALDSRKLDMQQSNDNVSNFAPKEMNRLYKAFQAAETPEEQAAIREQMNILNGGSDKKSKSIVINQTGQTLSPDGLTTTDNPAVIYNQDDNSFINIPQAERSFGDPAMQALQARDDITIKEKERLANLYMDGGDI